MENVETAADHKMDPMVELAKSLASSDFEVSKSSPNDPNKPHPRFSQYKNRNQLADRQSDQGKIFRIIMHSKILKNYKI